MAAPPTHPRESKRRVADLEQAPNAPYRTTRLRSAQERELERAAPRHAYAHAHAHVHAHTRGPQSESQTHPTIRPRARHPLASPASLCWPLRRHCALTSPPRPQLSFASCLVRNRERRSETSRHRLHSTARAKASERRGSATKSSARNTSESAERPSSPEPCRPKAGARARDHAHAHTRARSAGHRSAHQVKPRARRARRLFVLSPPTGCARHHAVPPHGTRPRARDHAHAHAGPCSERAPAASNENPTIQQPTARALLRHRAPRHPP